jgi:hypothetical protein
VGSSACVDAAGTGNLGTAPGNRTPLYRPRCPGDTSEIRDRLRQIITVSGGVARYAAGLARIFNFYGAWNVLGGHNGCPSLPSGTPALYPEGPRFRFITGCAGHH